jgi:hypothetical protein
LPSREWRCNSVAPFQGFANFDEAAVHLFKVADVRIASRRYEGVRQFAKNTATRATVDVRIEAGDVA